MRQWSQWPALLVVVAFLSGCGPTGKPPLPTYEVSGSITKDGVPLSGVIVSIVPIEATGLPAIGQSDANGEFNLNLSSTQPGANAGSHKVVLSGGGSAPTPEDYAKASKGGPPGAGQTPYPAEWTSPKTSPLTFDVGESLQNFLRIEIEE